LPILEDAKQAFESITGLARPTARDFSHLARAQNANTYKFEDDGATPNNPDFPLIHYLSPIALPPDFDPAGVFEELFASHGWTDAWRDGIYDYLHFHTRTHEVLGIARGHASVQFGGARGRLLQVKAGDVVVLPAGTGHQRLSSSADFLAVGAYPEGSRYDEPKPWEIHHDETVAAIAQVKPPATDPVYGKDGPVCRLWVRSR
jgi:uncharacterized protein YjlB